MEEYGCVFCDLPEEDGSTRYDFNRSKTDMSYRNYSLWPLEPADRPKKVPGPYDYVDNIKPDWMKEEVNRLFFQPMPTGNSQWPNQHSVYNPMGNQIPAPPTVMNEELGYNRERIDISLSISLTPAQSVIARPQTASTLRNFRQNPPPALLPPSPPPPLLQPWNKVVSNGKRRTDIKYKTGEGYSSSLEETALTTANNDTAIKKRSWCTFCYKNGETISFVTSHNLYDPLTKYVSCPVLRAHRCEICNASGNHAHTRAYCPTVRLFKGKVTSTTLALKSSKRQSNGKKRATESLQTTKMLEKEKKSCPQTITECFSYLTAH